MEFLQGTLDMLVLQTLAAGPMHGYGIAQAIRQSTEDAIAPEAGSLYPSLQRLELQGLLVAKWEVGKGKRRMRVYRLTPAGRKRLHNEVSQWEAFVRSVGRVLYPRPSEE
jgi:transcriptional regulator